MRNPPAVLIYDWDNTLVDGWAGVAAALNAAFAAFALPPWTADQTKRRVRESLRESFPKIFGAEWQRARDLFYAALAAQHLDHVTPMPGAIDALAAGSYLPQAVVSNKTGQFLRAEVAHLGWASHFRAVVGAGDASADKPDPAPILLALEKMGSAPGPNVWYLGDTALDMQTARAAGITAALVGDAEHDGGAEHAAPDIHFAGAHELAAALRDYAASSSSAGPKNS
ncbi:MAG: HAD family hydrolase [Acetobacteraceae bacterium]|nr:HAD family hydrolase [Acetobacteraceae bacterium]MBV8523475.1 HAD family hydrolase [Acetobacteraceae bacterium]